MDLTALNNKLLEARIKQEYYSLNGGFPNEACAINQTKDGWEVYYSERGRKSGLKFFAEESDACEYFFRLITSDDVIMNDRIPPSTEK